MFPNVKKWLILPSRSSYKIVSMLQDPSLQFIHSRQHIMCPVQLPVAKASGRLPEATSSFLVSDSEHLVSELLLSRALSLWNSLPLDVRQSRDNLMQFKMKLKTFLFQQFWALLWIQSNEGPYKCSILLLLLHDVTLHLIASDLATVL